MHAVLRQGESAFHQRPHSSDLQGRGGHLPRCLARDRIPDSECTILCMLPKGYLSFHPSSDIYPTFHVSLKVFS